MQFPFPVLVGDIGGTNARFSLVAEPGAAPSRPEHLGTHDHPSLEAAIAEAMPRFAAKARSMVVCAAGPVDGRRVELTNARWIIDGAEVAEAAGLEQGLILNDFEAQALALPVLGAGAARAIGEASVAERGAQLVVGPGTGLGAAALIEVDGKHFALTSEAGHVDFGPVGDEEAAIWPHIPMTPHGRVSAETVLSGPGLARLHGARFTARGLVAPGLGEAAIVERAKREHGGEEAATVRLFWRLVARFAGDLALAFLATGGVTLAGGVLPRIAELLDPAVFRARFEDKAPFGDLLRGISTRLVLADDTVLHGLAALAAQPERYAIGYGTRAWR